MNNFKKLLENMLKTNLKINDIVYSDKRKPYLARIVNVDKKEAELDYLTLDKGFFNTEPLRNLKLFKGKLPSIKLGERINFEGFPGLIHSILNDKKVEIRLNTGDFKTVNIKDII